MRHVLAILLALAIPSFPACAFVGKRDYAERFPHVVQLRTTYPDGASFLCTGVVGNDGIVSTAAHCVWHDGVAAQKVTIIFKDVDGVERRASSLKIFTRPSFPTAYAKWQSTGATVDFHRMSMLDIAFIVPDVPVVTGGLKNWITEVLSASPRNPADDENFTRYEPGMSLLTSTLRQKIVSDVALEIGDLEKTSALVVGFGNSFCKNFARDESCTSDGFRRYGEIPLLKEVTASGQSFDAPWLWCTGPDLTGLSPIRSGDSGGPLFVRAHDGRWLFAGHISGGNNRENCASSLFSHLDLWRDAVYFKAHEGVFYTTHTDAERRSQAVRAIAEYLESWSAENPVALRRVLAYHAGKRESAYVYNMRPVTLDQLYAEKEAFAKQWPKRTYEISPDAPVEVVCGRMLGIPALCRARAQVSWRLTSANDSSLSSGLSQLDVLIGLQDLEGDWVSAGGPLFEVENWRTLSEDGASKGSPSGRLRSGLQVRQDTDYRGGDLYPKGFRDIGYEQCYNLCDFNDACVGYTYVRKKGWCWPKGQLLQPSNNPDVVSGVK